MHSAGVTFSTLSFVMSVYLISRLVQCHLVL